MSSTFIQIDMVSFILIITAIILTVVNIRYYKPRMIFCSMPDNHVRVDIQYDKSSYWEDNNGNRIPTKERITKTLFVL